MGENGCVLSANCTCMGVLGGIRLTNKSQLLPGVQVFMLTNDWCVRQFKISPITVLQLSCNSRKWDFRLCENKGADQLCSNCTADQPTVPVCGFLGE